MTRRRRRTVLGTAAVAGVLAGLLVALALPDPGQPADPAARADPPPPTSAVRRRAGTTSTLLAWTAGGLPAAFAATVRALDGVERTATVHGDEARLLSSWDAEGRPVDHPEPGWHIPLDTLAIDPHDHAAFLPPGPAATVRALTPGQALLTESSARLRRLGVGARIHLAGRDLTVAGIVGDVDGAGAELLVTTVDADRIGVATERYLLIAHTGDRDDLQRSIAGHLDGRAVRFRSPAETLWLRHGDAVDPPSVLKQALGEFAIRDGTGRDVEVDPAWVARSITTGTVPILGRVTCHRDVLPALREVMGELEQDGLAHMVDPATYAGCFVARRTAPGQPLSHHAWGAALDLNVGGNPRGSFSTQDPRLVEALTRRGFTWGGAWLVPDPAHYEAPLDP